MLASLWIILFQAGGVLAAKPVTLSFRDGTVIRLTPPSPELWGGAKLPDANSGADGSATVSGLKLTRTIARDRGGYRIRLAVTNQRDRAIELKSLIPLQIVGQSNLLVAGTAVAA